MTEPPKSYRSGTQWDEADYRAKGWVSLKVRISELAKLRLDELAEAAGTSKAEVVEDLINAAHKRLEGAKP